MVASHVTIQSPVIQEIRLRPEVQEDLFQRAKFDLAGPLAREFVASESFRMTEQPRDNVLVLVQFHHEPSTDEVLATFSRLGLVQPTEQDALRFTIASPLGLHDLPVVFLHTDNLWRVPGTREQVCVVHLQKRRHLYTIWYRNNWGKRYVFAARKA